MDVNADEKGDFEERVVVVSGDWIGDLERLALHCLSASASSSSMACFVGRFGDWGWYFGD